MSTADLSGARWRTATRSGQSNGGCVEIADDLRDVTGIRDSLRPQDGAHVTSKAAFAAFLAAAKAGYYDMDRFPRWFPPSRPAATARTGEGRPMLASRF